MLLYVIDDFINENNDILVLVQSFPSQSHNGTASASENFTIGTSLNFLDKNEVNGATSDSVTYECINQPMKNT